MDIDDIEKEFLRIKTCLESGRDSFAKKQYKESKQLFEEALTLCDKGHSRANPDRLECLERLADTLIVMKNYAAADSTLIELRSSVDPGQRTQSATIVLLLKLSYCQEKSGRLKEAASSYEQLIALVESDPGQSDQTMSLILERYKAVLGRMSIHGAKVKALEDRARNLRKQAHSGEGRAEKLLEAVEELYGESSGGKKDRLRNQTFRTRGPSGPSNAVTAIVNVVPAGIGVLVIIGLIIVFTRPVQQGQFQSVEQQYAIAKAGCMSGDYLKSAEIFDRLLAKDPKLAACWFYNAGCKLKLGDYDGAIKNYSALIELAPDCEPALVGRAGAYLFKHDYDKALEDGMQAVRLNPKDMRAYDFRGAAYMHLGKTREADLDLQKAMDVKGEKHDAYIWPALPDPAFTSGSAKHVNRDSDAKTTK